MTFKVDENLPDDAASTLRREGFDAHTVRDEELQGATDELVSGAARSEGRVLITLDRDFCDIRAYPPSANAGIVVLRPVSQDKHAVLSLLRRLLLVLKRESPVGKLWIVERTASDAVPETTSSPSPQTHYAPLL